MKVTLFTKPFSFGLQPPRMIQTHDVLFLTTVINPNLNNPICAVMAMLRVVWMQQSLSVTTSPTNATCIMSTN